MYFILWLITYSQKAGRIKRFRKIICVLVTEVLSWHMHKVFDVWRLTQRFLKPEILGIIALQATIMEYV